MDARSSADVLYLLPFALGVLLAGCSAATDSARWTAPSLIETHHCQRAALRPSLAAMDATHTKTVSESLTSHASAPLNQAIVHVRYDVEEPMGAAVPPPTAGEFPLPITKWRSESPNLNVHEFENPRRLPPAGSERLTFGGMLSDQWARVRSDHLQFYSANGMLWLAGGMSAAALMANTGFDHHFARDSFFDNIILAPNDELYEKLHQPKFLGDGYYTIPAFALSALSEPLLDSIPLGPETSEWGQRSLRTLLVGGPPLLGIQWLTGGGRPDESLESSEWRPFQDNNGVSGHAFMGAIPFMSAAKMTDNIWLRSGLYAASALPAVSRMNDDAHYFSQVFLGWWIAYLAECAVDRSHRLHSNHHFFTYPEVDGIGFGVDFIR